MKRGGSNENHYQSARQGRKEAEKAEAKVLICVSLCFVFFRRAE
jgi:hypothetical protein